jgi:dihydroxy-acid dehydratase
MTRKAFENAITVVIALGGSTNAVLHLLAMAHEADVKLSIDDFTRIGKRVPVLADLKPSGKYNMSHLVSIGGLPPLMKMLLDAGCSTATCSRSPERPSPRTSSRCPPLPGGPGHCAAALQPDQGRQPPADPVRQSRSGRRRGQDLRQGRPALHGKAIVFESEETALHGILDGKVKSGHVIVIRNEGPRGGPGMREMLAPTSAIMGKGLGKEVALITDGRFSGGSHGFVVGHITPEAAIGWPARRGSQWRPHHHRCGQERAHPRLPAKDIKARLKARKPKKAKATRGVLAKYAKLVTTASEGAVTDKNL